MKKKASQLQLNKKQISILNQSSIIGGIPNFSNQCPEITVQITRCYGANQCRKWHDRF